MDKIYVPICRRTRRKTAMDLERLRQANKRARIASRRRFLEKENSVKKVDNAVVLYDDSADDDDYDDDVIQIDQKEFNEINSKMSIVGVEKDENLGCLSEKGKEIMNCDENGDHSDDSLEILDVRFNPNDIFNDGDDVADHDGDGDGGGDGDGDDDGDGEGHHHHDGMGVLEGIVEQKEGSSSSSSEDDQSDDNDYKMENPDDFWSSEYSSEENSVDERCLEAEDVLVDDHDAIDDDGNSSLVTKDVHNRKRKEHDSGFEFQEQKVPDELVLPKFPVENIREDDLVEVRVQCDSEMNLPSSKSKKRKFHQPLTIVLEEESSVELLDEEFTMPENLKDSDEVVVQNKVDNIGVEHEPQPKVPENSRASVSDGKKANIMIEHETRPKVPETSSNVGNEEEMEFVVGLAARLPKKLRKPKDYVKSCNVEVEPKPPSFPESSIDGRERENVVESRIDEEQQKKVKGKEVENATFDNILDDAAAGLEDIGCSNKDTNDDLGLKFRYGVENVVVDKTFEENELETLFNELDFGLGVCDIGSEAPCSDKNEEETILCDSAILQEQLCFEGRHYLIEDEQIGIRCKFCFFVQLEIRDVTPAFSKYPFGRSGRISRSFLDDHASSSVGCQFPDSRYDMETGHADDTRGTVWDLIPGTKNKLYEHQIKGFEFIWRNIEGGTRIDQLDKPSRFGLGGCMICHAPGTGKTRLAIVFLQSFVKQYPMSKPIILAPSSILLTWEEEFARLKIDVPFLNLNSSEISSGIESKYSRRVNSVQRRVPVTRIRMLKLCEWVQGKGILGISYTLFEKLAGERKGTNDRIKQTLLKKSGILVLDEGHTPRNDASKLWKVLSEVDTKRRIILSGTPFQNNIEELLNTMSLVREEFGHPRLHGQYVNSGWRSKADRRYNPYNKMNEEQRIEQLKKKMEPYVNVHKGEILRQTLRGLFHSVLVLKPSEIQNSYLRLLTQMKNGLHKDHLVSIAAVHPSLLCMGEQVPEFVNKDSLEKYKRDWNAGVKIKFLFELIKISGGEKVLVFSQFIVPLTLIADLLKSDFKWTDGREFLYMDGKLGTKQRQYLIRKFNDPHSEARVLLASTKACCEGIHLVGASRVVLLDVVWNPSVERQAISRAYRLGQKKDVFVYHLITAGTHEVDKYYRQVAKDRLSELVFTSSEGEEGQKTSTLQKVSEDRILEEMIQHKKTENMFEKIIYQPKADELIESFGPLNL